MFTQFDLRLKTHQVHHNNNARLIGNVFIHQSESTSTNLILRQLITSKIRPKEGTVLFTDYQSAGIGQLGSAWHTEPGKAVTMSVVLYPEFLQPELHYYLTLMSSIAVHQFASEFIKNKTLSIKWPNDIFIEDRKLCGILPQSIMGNKRIKSIIVGIGINVFTYVNYKEVQKQIAFLDEENNPQQSILQLIQGICKKLEVNYQLLKAGEYKTLLNYYYRNMYKYKERISYFDCNNYTREEGVIEGISHSGELLISQGSEIKSYSLKSIKYPIYD